MSRFIAIWLISLLLLLFLLPLPGLTDLDQSSITPTTQNSQISGHEETILDHTVLSTGVVISTESISQTTPLENTVPQSVPEPSFQGSPILLISEVFFDGSDERFEISNIGSGSFTGILVIKGVKSTDLSLGLVSVPPGASYVRGDTMAFITNRSVIKGSGLGLSISDSNALQILLYSSGQQLDQFIMDSSLVGSLPNNCGFEKARSGNSLITVPTSTGTASGVSGAWIANPGTISTLPALIPAYSENTGAATVTGSVQPEAPTAIPPVLTGFSSATGIISGRVIISEIHPGADLLPEYLELYFPRPFVGSLVIAGLGSSASAKNVQIDAYTGQYLVITDSLTGFLDLSPLMLVDSISLTDGGEPIGITDLSGNTYAQSIYTGFQKNQSWYGNAWGGYDKSAYLTPGFSEYALAYLPVAITPTLSATEKKQEDTYYQSLYKKRKDRYYDLKSQISLFGIAVNKAGSVYKKEGSAEVELVDGSEEFAASEPKEASMLKIMAVLPDPAGKDEDSEQLTITLLSGATVDLSKVVLYSNKKKVLLQGTISSGEQRTLKGTFSMLNKPACVELQEGDIIYDRFCYGQPAQNMRIGLTGNISTHPLLSGSEDFEWMKELKLTLLTGEACALFSDIPFDCIPIKSVLDEKTKAKYDKKLASLQEKYQNKQRQYTGLQERYKSTKSSLDAKWRKYYQQVKSVRASYKEKLTYANLEVKIRKNYGKLLQTDLKNNRYMVWQNSDIAFIHTLLDSNLTALKKKDNSTTLTLHGQTFSLGDLRKQHAFVTDPGVIIDTLVGRGLDIISPELGVVRAKGLALWYENDE